MSLAAAAAISSSQMGANESFTLKYKPIVGSDEINHQHFNQSIPIAADIDNRL